VRCPILKPHLFLKRTWASPAIHNLEEVMLHASSRRALASD
jgi:hypothetical protein